MSLSGVSLFDGEHRDHHENIIDAPLSVKHFGAVGDGTTDDTAAIQEAFDQCLHPDGDHFTKTLVFPWTEQSYVFGALDWHTLDRAADPDTERWFTIQVDGKLKPTETIVLPARRLKLIGGSGAKHAGFAGYGYTEIDGSLVGTDPVISLEDFQATGLVVDGFLVRGFSGNGMFMPGEQPNLTFRGLFFEQASAASGDFSCVKLAASIDDSFEIHFFDCGFDTQTESGYGLELTDFGLTSIERCYFGNRGIYIAADLSTTGGIDIRDCLAETLDHSAITLDSSNGVVQGIHVDRFENADSDQSPTRCLFHNTGTDTYDVQATNCGGYTNVVESGSDRINGLLHRQSRTSAGTTVNQTNRYEHMDRFGRHSIAAPLALVSFDATAADTTPSAGETSFYVLTNGSPTTVSDFDNEVDGQIMHLLFMDGNTTIDHNAGIRLSGGADFVGTANDTLTLISRGGIWYEVSRSVNG
jgi:hypothetical protein